MHFLLLDCDDSIVAHQQQHMLLGHVYVDLVQGSGFPFCSLLQLPTPDDSSNSDKTILQPGAVVLRLPIAGLQDVAGCGRQQQFNRPASSSNEQQQQHGSPTSLMLPGPHALQALLHELGHALSYLCPFFTSTLQLQQQQQTGDGSSSSSSDVYSLCLLSGPAPGVDVRELSSHLFEHWCRAPQSLMVGLA
jgi:hypothetical protein